MPQQTIYSTVPELFQVATATLHAIDAAGEKFAMIVRAPKTGNISGCTFRLGTVTTPQTLRVSLQDVDSTTGDPDGTADQSATIASGSLSTNSFQSVTFGSSRAVTKNAWLAVVVEFDGTAGNLNLAREATGMPRLPYVDHYTTSWTKTGCAPILVLHYDDGSFPYLDGCLPGPGASVTYAVNTGTFDEYGVRFTSPVPLTVHGVTWMGSLTSATCDYEAILYDAAGTVLASCAMDGHIGVFSSFAPRDCLFDTPVEIAANTLYRATIRPTTTTSLTWYYVQLAQAAHREVLPWGTSASLTKRLDQGASWTDDTTQVPCMVLQVSKLADDAGSGGGLKRHPGMTGGCLG